MIKHGDVAMELMKPYHLLDKLVAMDIGQKFLIQFVQRFQCYSLLFGL